MVEVDKAPAFPSPPRYRMSAKKQQLFSPAMKRTSEWICSQEIPSDIKVQVGEASFSLHKLPLVSKCGYVRKLVSHADLSIIEIPEVPGGVEAFQLAAKFAYGINFEISVDNVAMLRCVADSLEMTEEYAVGNLVNRTETYLNEVALSSLSGALAVLHSSENLLPVAEKLNLVTRCVDAIAYIVCTDNQFCSSGTTENSSTQDSFGSSTSHSHPMAVVNWWAEELTVLRIDMFQKVLMAMKARGFKQYALGPVLMLYAQKSLRGLDVFGRGKKKIEPREEHEKRVVLETIVSLLPRENNSMSVSFLSMLLRAAIHLETTVACRLDLEKRMGLQLSQAVLDDLLIPSGSHTGDTVFDVDAVQRILVNHLDQERASSGRMARNNSEDDHYVSPSFNETERVGRLMESYLAEIATDPNLAITKFIGLAEQIPEQSRVVEDGMYRAVDIYLKAHPSLTEMERKKLCSLMACQKLSREACAHAAQNDRLPVQTVVQVLYYEQQRFRDVMNGSLVGESLALLPKITPYSAPHTKPPLNELATIKRENEDLKLELVKMKMKLNELGKPNALIENSPSIDKPPLPKKSFMNSVSKRLGKINPFVRGDGIRFLDGKGRKNPKDRRHSIS